MSNIDRNIDSVIPDDLSQSGNLGDPELQRVANENQRILQENSRVAAESGRVTLFGQRLAQWQAQVDALVGPGGGVPSGVALQNGENAFTAVNVFNAGLRSLEALNPTTRDETVPTTAWVQDRLGNYALASALQNYALLSSPQLSGVPTAPTAAVTNNSTQIANTAFVQSVVAGATGVDLSAYSTTAQADAKYAPKASPVFTGVPTAPTATSNTNTTQIATTAFVQAVVASVSTGGGSAPTFTGLVTAQGGVLAQANISVRSDADPATKEGFIILNNDGSQFGSIVANITDGVFEWRRGDSAGAAQVYIGATTLTVSGQITARFQGPATQFTQFPIISDTTNLNAQTAATANGGTTLDNQLASVKLVKAYVASYGTGGTGGGFTQAQIEDIVGNMFTNNSASGITDTYNTSTRKIDMTVTTSGATATGNAVRLVPAPTGTAATDTSNIQSTINASSPGDTIQFQRGTYNINAPIVLKGGRQYRGHGAPFASPNDGGSTFIRQGNNSNIANATVGFTGLFVMEGWDANRLANTVARQNCNLPIRITNLTFAGNAANNPTSNACGFVFWNFWAYVDNCGFYDMPLDGVRATDTDSAGIAMNNSASENQIMHCRFANNGGSHFRQHQGSPGGFNTNNWNLDGRFLYNYLDGHSAKYGIWIDRAAGWYVVGNHMYGNTGGSCILVNNSFATTVTTNYLEPMGKNDSGTHYGIKSDILGGRGITISNNVIGADASSATATYICIDLQANATNALATVVGNQFYGQGANTSRITGLRMVAGGGAGQGGRYAALNIASGIGTKNNISTAWVRETD